MPLGRCIHWSGVGCTFPDPHAAFASLEQEPGYYASPCPRKQGGGCVDDGYIGEVTP